MVGLDDAVEILERDRFDAFVGQTEARQHPDRRVGRQRLEQHELHFREEHPAVALRDQHRPRSAGRRCRERARVDDVSPAEGVETEPGPRELGERQAGHELDVDADPSRALV